MATPMHAPGTPHIKAPEEHRENDDETQDRQRCADQQGFKIAPNQELDQVQSDEDCHGRGESRAVKAKDGFAIADSGTSGASICRGPFFVHRAWRQQPLRNRDQAKGWPHCRHAPHQQQPGRRRSIDEKTDREGIRDVDEKSGY